MQVVIVKMVKKMMMNFHVIVESEGDCVWQGLRRSMGCSFHRQGAAYWIERLVIFKEDRVGGRAKTQRLTNTSKTISRRFYHKVLLTFWKRKLIGLCEYVRVSNMRNVTRAKMPNLGVAIWRTILNIKLLCFPRCVPEIRHIYQNLLNFTNAFKCYHQKCKLASL